MSQSRSHLVLVPGFAGFDILGSVVYYCGVTEVLRKTDTGPYQGPLSVHCFPNLPTASVDTRAHALLRWLADRFRQGVFHENAGRGQRDGIHLVGHSTGGRDIKTLMLLLLAASERRERVYGVQAESILESICSIQFLSTPHRGTNLAHYFRRRRPLVTGAATLLHWWLRAARPRDASAVARLIRTFLRTLGYSDGISRAALDTLDRFHATACDGLARAEARGEYYNVLRWLLHVAEDAEVFHDLDPLSSAGQMQLAAGQLDRHPTVSSVGVWPCDLVGCIENARQEGRASLLGAEVEDDLSSYYKRKGVALRSIVTRAKLDPGGAFLGAFGIFYGITADITNPEVVPALGPPCAVPRLDDPTRLEPLTPAMNDGIVNCVSMVYPDATQSFLVDADHADVMGHYRFIGPEDGDGTDPNYGGYDLLQSRSSFDQSQFDMLWRSIGSFAMESDRFAGAAQRAPVVSSGAPAGAQAVSHFRSEPPESEGGAE